jgi:protease-4
MDNAFPTGSSGSTPPPPPPMPPAAAYPPPPLLRPGAPVPAAPRKSGRGWMIVAIVLALLLGLSFLGNLGSAVLGGSSGQTMGGGGGRGGLMPVYVENNRAKHDVLLIDVDGVITSQAFDSSGNNLVDLIEKQLDIAAQSPRIRAVILKINSPGGEVLASDDIATLIANFQDDTGKPVIAQMNSLAASGGYYISAPCRWIVANKLTITGSIGVIMSGYNYRGLMDKIGLRTEVFKSGKFKDMLSGTKTEEEILPGEREMVMELVMETYGQFTNIVASGRQAAYAASDAENTGQELVSNWAEFADGRILSGAKAHELGLVDELGNFDTAFERALTLAGIADANLVAYRLPFDLGSLFRIFGETEAKSSTVKIDLGLDALKLKKGQLYFIAPTSL